MGQTCFPQMAKHSPIRPPLKQLAVSFTQLYFIWAPNQKSDSLHSAVPKAIFISQLCNSLSDVNLFAPPSSSHIGT